MLLIYGRVSQLDDDIDHDMADIDVDDDANIVSNNGSDCDIDFIVFGYCCVLMIVGVYERCIATTRPTLSLSNDSNHYIESMSKFSAIVGLGIHSHIKSSRSLLHRDLFPTVSYRTAFFVVVQFHSRLSSIYDSQQIACRPQQHSNAMK